METKSSLTLHYIAIHACDERIMHTSSMTITQTRFQWMATKNLEGLNSPVLTPELPAHKGYKKAVIQPIMRMQTHVEPV
jgi:hypothetical protein